METIEVTTEITSTSIPSQVCEFLEKNKAVISELVVLLKSINPLLGAAVGVIVEGANKLCKIPAHSSESRSDKPA
ncbi:hypothetical protein [Caballeronia sp. GaOx3]|uniref:hypothetical protein n=1 Tax=Caballeronia sp. GaOx3 TaxID=2921740 RepID=UPI002028D3A8|nr:hypothetical protein [Caballeronia sp. GaOx3]